jgi:hypothetical protein
VWHVAGMQEKGDACRVCLGNLKERHLSRDIGIQFVNRIKIYNKRHDRVWSGHTWPRTGAGGSVWGSILGGVAGFTMSVVRGVH